jgi:TusA-related sulfurtransferase
VSENTRDAGDLGCGEGLAAWFRTQLRDTPPGDTLRAVVRDPAAREELPALARLMGHTVTSIEAGESCFVITVEKTR